MAIPKSVTTTLPRAIATELRGYADAALVQGMAVLREANAAVSANRRAMEEALRSAPVPAPAYAWIGAADLLVEAVSKFVQTLPTDAAGSLAKAQETGKSSLTKAQREALSKVAELSDRLAVALDAGLGSAKDFRDVDLHVAAADLQAIASDLQSKARSAADAYLALARNLYETLTARGEERLAELVVGGGVIPVPTVAAARIPAKKVPAKKVPAKKVPAKKVPAKKVPAKKVPAKQVPAKQVPAKKAEAARARPTTAQASEAGSD